MKTEKTLQNPSIESSSKPSSIKKEDQPNNIRRDFLKRFGKYAATTPVVTFALMSPRTSKAVTSPIP